MEDTRCQQFQYVDLLFVSRHISPVPNRQIQRFTVSVSTWNWSSSNILLKPPNPLSPLFPPVQFNTFNSTSINWASAVCKALSVKYNKEKALVLVHNFSTGEVCSLAFPGEGKLPLVSLGTEVNIWILLVSLFSLKWQITSWSARLFPPQFLCTCTHMHTLYPHQICSGKEAFLFLIFFQVIPFSQESQVISHFYGHGDSVKTLLICQHNEESLSLICENPLYKMTSWKRVERRVKTKGIRLPQSNTRADIFSLIIRHFPYVIITP